MRAKSTLFVSDAFVYGLMDGEAVGEVTMKKQGDYLWGVRSSWRRLWIEETLYSLADVT